MLVEEKSRSVETVEKEPPFAIIRRGASYSWITVQDDGCGFDNKKISRANSGLGLRLISSLVQSSLKGELFIETGENGTSIRFSFSMPQAG